MKKLKTENRNNIDALRQKISHIEEAKDLVRPRIIEWKRRIKIFPSENSLDSTEYVERQKDENESDLGVPFKLAEENKIIHNQLIVSTLVGGTEEFKNSFFLIGYFTLGDKEKSRLIDFFKIVVNWQN